jgi:hypothetical protein
VKVSARERKLLIALGALAGIALLRFLYSAASPPAAPAAASTRAAGSSTRAAGAGTAQRGRRGRTSELPTEVVALEIAALDRIPEDLEFGRDPFRYGPVPPPPPPPPPTAEELRRRAEEAERRRLEAIEQARIDAIPKPPPVTLKYLGSFGPERRRVAVFADASGENLYNARTGEVLEGKFIVDKIGYESVDLKFVGFPDEPARRLPIGG